MPSNNLLNSDISFIEAAKITLKENGNVPMTSKEIWDYIDKNKLKKTSGKTPWHTIRVHMTEYSINSNDSYKKKGKIFEIIDGKFRLVNYVSKRVKESLIEDGFIHISNLKDVLSSLGVELNTKK